MSAAAAQPGSFTGRKFLGVIVGFFALVIGVNLLLAYEARRSFTGIVVGNGYVASQDFNKGLEAGRKQAALGWNVALGTDAGGLAVTATGADGRPLTGLAVTARLARPLSAEARMIALTEDAPGRYAARLPLGPGAWDAEITLRAGARRFYRAERFQVE